MMVVRLGRAFLIARRGFRPADRRRRSAGTSVGRSRAPRPAGRRGKSATRRRRGSAASIDILARQAVLHLLLRHAELEFAELLPARQPRQRLAGVQPRLALGQVERLGRAEAGVGGLGAGRFSAWNIDRVRFIGQPQRQPACGRLPRRRPGNRRRRPARRRCGDCRRRPAAARPASSRPSARSSGGQSSVSDEAVRFRSPSRWSRAKSGAGSAKGSADDAGDLPAIQIHHGADLVAGELDAVLLKGAVEVDGAEVAGLGRQRRRRPWRRRCARIRPARRRG